MVGDQQDSVKCEEIGKAQDLDWSVGKTAKFRQHSANANATWGSGKVQQAGSSGIKNFQSRDFRDGILQNPGIPGFFGTGLAWNFYPGIFPKKNGNGQISQIICLQMENFVVVILYLVYFAIKYMYFENLWVKSSEFPKMRTTEGM